MSTVNMLETKSSMSKLVDAMERVVTPEVVIARHGRPTARLVPLAATKRPGLGVAMGHFVLPDNIDTGNAEVARLFHG